MSPKHLSSPSVSRFDTKKLLVIMSIAVVTLIIDSNIGNVADFIPEQLASSDGITIFIVIWAIITAIQYYILAYVKQSNRESKARATTLNVIHRIVTISQFILAAIIASVILQILIMREYNTLFLYAAISISYGLWILTLGLLARAFFRWYNSRKENVMVLILALSMVSYVVNGVLGLYSHIDLLAQQNPIIRVGDVAVFPEFTVATLGDLITLANQIASTVSYLLTWIGTVMLLRPYMKNLGKIKFWIIMGSAMVYYLIEVPFFALGYFTPSENSDAITNLLIFTLAAVFTGIVFGAAFLSVVRTLKLGSPVRNNMIIVAYGFVVFYIAGSAIVSQAAYPPFGLVSVSFTGLSCYLIYNGLYFAAISVSQDMTLRRSIRKSVMEQSKLLESIGTAQMEREVQARTLAVAKKMFDIMAENSGVEVSMNENDMKDYVELVIKELRGK